MMSDDSNDDDDDDKLVIVRVDPEFAFEGTERLFIYPECKTSR